MRYVLLPAQHNEMLQCISVLLSLCTSLIHFTSDIWTRKLLAQAYMCISAHFLSEDFRLHAFLVDLTHMEDGRHTAEHIKAVFLAALHKNQLDAKKGVFVLDNCSTNLAAMQQLGWSNIGCFAHLVHLCVGDGKKVPFILQLTTGMKEVVTLTRRALRWHRCFTGFSANLREA